MVYAWNTAKAIENRRKHGIDFADAIHNILFIITTTRGDEICRVISARRATRHGQKRYYTHDREAW